MTEPRVKIKRFKTTGRYIATCPCGWVIGEYFLSHSHHWAMLHVEMHRAEERRSVENWLWNRM